MRNLIFATNNNHKVQELNALLNGQFIITTLQQAGITIDIPEPHNSLEANAREKSTTIFKLTGRDCFGEDTGLEVAALSGAPGVKSARYAGAEADAANNLALLLKNMQGVGRREARFRTVISLILNGEEHLFEGSCEGEIIDAPRGEKGFGYDPVFIPAGAGKTFAEMPLEEKNLYSHRAKAVAQLSAFLLTNANI